MTTNWTNLRRVWKLTQPFWTGKDRRAAWGWLSLLLGMLVLIACINVQISFAERAVATSLQQVKEAEFWRNLYFYAFTFVVALGVVGNFGWVKARLHSAWRNALSQQLLGRYYDDSYFHDVNAQVDNPDQRIGQDINIFCDKVLTIAMSVLDSVLAFIAFIAILWLINFNLVLVAVGYAAVGTFVMVRYGKRVVGMFANQEKLEADFRRNMVYASENALSIASYHGAKRELKTALAGLKSLITHWNGVLSVQRNLVLFKTGYDYMIIVVPMAMTASLFFAGELDAGGVVQAGTAFGRVLGALSLIVAQFQMFAELAASAQRLGDFEETIKRLEEKRDAGPSADEVRTESDGNRVALKHVTVVTPDQNRILVQDVNVELPPGTRLLVVGPSGVGKSTLLRTVAGLLRKGKGAVVRPAKTNTLFLPQKPYMPVGTLRDQITYPVVDSDATDVHLLEVLRRVNLGDLATRFEGGFNAVKPWQHVLSGGEQQRISIARVLMKQPKFVILDEATSGLDAENEQAMYELITACGVTTISVAHRESLARHHDLVLQMAKDGSWRLLDARQFLTGNAA